MPKLRVGMAYLIVGLVFTILTSTGDKIDSLKTVIESADHACPEPCRGDTTMVKALNALAGKFITTNPDTALELAEHALELSNTLEYTKGQITSYYNIGYVNYLQSNYDQAITNWKKTLELREQKEDKQGIADSYNNIGIIYKNQSNYPLALDCYFKSLEIFEELDNKQGMADSYNNIGIIYKYQSDYPLALEYYFKSLKIREELGDKRGMAHSYTNIGNLYIAIYEQGLPHSEAYRGDASTDLSPEAKAKGEASAKVDSLAQSQREGKRAPETFALLDTALIYQQKALAIKKELSDEYGTSSSLCGIGSIYSQKGNYVKALNHYQRAALLADSVGALQRASEAHSGLAGCYEKLGNHKLALEHYKQYSTLKDSVFNEEKSKDIGKLEAKHEFEMAEQKRKRQEEEQARLQDEKTGRRNLLQYSGILIFIVAFFITLLFSGRLNIPVRLAEGGVFFTFLLVFEFLLVLSDLYVEQYTGGEPAYKLMINAALAALIFPLHSIAEAKLKQRLFRTRKRIIEKKQASG
ncbi:MAG: tetratricopeptide repeat protein [Bacteroidota bacterium]